MKTISVPEDLECLKEVIETANKNNCFTTINVNSGDHDITGSWISPIVYVFVNGDATIFEKDIVFKGNVLDEYLEPQKSKEESGE